MTTTTTAMGYDTSNSKIIGPDTGRVSHCVSDRVSQSRTNQPKSRELVLHSQLTVFCLAQLVLLYAQNRSGRVYVCQLVAGSDRWDPGSFHSGGPYSLHRPHHQREYTRAQTKNPFGAVCCTHWLHKNCFAPDMFTYKLLARRTECALTRGICTRGLPFVSQLFAPEIWEAEACSLFPIYLQHQKPHELKSPP